MRRGELWRLTGGRMAAVISADDFNARGLQWPLCVPVTPRPLPDVDPPSVFIIELDPVHDPVNGALVLPVVQGISRELAHALVGRLSAGTMARVDAGLRRLLDLGERR